MTSVIDPAAEPERAAATPAADRPEPAAHPVHHHADGHDHAGHESDGHGPAGVQPGWSVEAAAGDGQAPGLDGQGPVWVAPPPSRWNAFMTRIATRSPRWLGPAAILACVAGTSAYVLISDPTDGVADAAPTCLLKLTTGFDCPGCGGTRAFFYALHGNIPAAARHHAVFVFALPFLIYMYLAWAGRRMFGLRLPKLRVSPLAISLFLGAWFAFTIIRNLPWAPFTWLYV